MANFPVTGPYDVQYRALQFQPVQLLKYNGVLGTTDGTTAAVATHKAIACLPTGMNIKVSAAVCRFGVGGTAAGTGTAPVFQIVACPDQAGTGVTGTLFTLSTAVDGTDGSADNAQQTFTAGADTDVAAGSYICLIETVGDDAIAGGALTINDVMIAFKNDWD